MEVRRSFGMALLMTSFPLRAARTTSNPSAAYWVFVNPTPSCAFISRLVLDTAVGGIGPQPVALLEPLMNWVEHGRAPAALRSENWNGTGVTMRSRQLCPYPKQARLSGRGSGN